MVQKYFNDVFVTCSCWILENSKGAGFIYRFPTYLGHKFSDFELEEGGERAGGSATYLRWGGRGSSEEGVATL